MWMDKWEARRVEGKSLHYTAKYTLYFQRKKIVFLNRGH